MIVLTPPRRPGSAAGFSLIEIAVSLGIIAIALVSLLALLFPAMEAGRQTASQTVVGVILEDVHNRLEGELLEETPDSAPFVYFYDDQGQFIDTSQPAEIQRSKIYRAEVIIKDIASAPDDTSGLMSSRIDIYTPINPDSGDAFPIGTAEPETTVTFYVSPLTGPDWPSIDSSYVPRIEF